jgi:hypothetical protein
MAEQWVKLLAHWKGCEVFANVGCTGQTDLVLLHPSLGSLQIDVKCATYRPAGNKTTYGWYAAKAYLVKQPVYPVIVEPDGDVANWRVRWDKNRTPVGWEHFWANDNRFYKVTSTKPNEPHIAD